MQKCLKSQIIAKETRKIKISNHKTILTKDQEAPFGQEVPAAALRRLHSYVIMMPMIHLRSSIQSWITYKSQVQNAEPNLPFQRIEGGANLGHTPIQPRPFGIRPGGTYLSHASICQTCGTYIQRPLALCSEPKIVILCTFAVCSPALLVIILPINIVPCC